MTIKLRFLGQNYSPSDCRVETIPSDIDSQFSEDIVIRSVVHYAIILHNLRSKSIAAFSIQRVIE